MADTISKLVTIIDGMAEALNRVTTSVVTLITRHHL